MFIEHAKPATHRELLVSRRERETEARAEALLRRVRVVLIYRTQGRERRIELLRFLRQIHSVVKRRLHCGDQSVFFRRDGHDFVAKSQLESQRSVNVPVVLEIPAEENLPHVPVGVLSSGELHVELQRARLHEIAKVVESISAVAPAAATDLLIPVVLVIDAYAEGMRTARNRETV